MSQPGWIEIRAKLDVEPDDWSPFAGVFDAHGCPSTMIEGSSIVGYLADVEGADEVAAELEFALESLGARVEIGTIEPQDWSELWKVHFKPRRIGKRFVLRPTWESYAVQEGDVEIVLDPGQAFGTGDHQTTRLCLAEIERLDGSLGEVADIGCGSGVLAIAAAKLGGRVVLASDLDPISVQVARANAKLNGMEFQCVEAAGFDGLSGQVDTALSNIISATLIRLSGEAARAIRPGGRWIVSGIIDANWPDVRVAAEAAGFALEHESREDEWVGATFRR